MATGAVQPAKSAWELRQECVDATDMAMKATDVAHVAQTAETHATAAEMHTAAANKHRQITKDQIKIMSHDAQANYHSKEAFALKNKGKE